MQRKKMNPTEITENGSTVLPSSWQKKRNPPEITEIEMTSTSMSRFLTRVETKVLITEFDKKESIKKY